MSKYLLFLHGRYSPKDITYFKKLISKQTTIAVDGGYSFFKESKLTPDILLGDFDSLNLNVAKFSPSIKIFKYPSEKNKTDSQLAIEYAIENKASSIEIIMPEIGEPDHYLGNLLNLFSKSVLNHIKEGGKVKIVSREYVYYLLSDNQVTIKDCRGSIVSLIPISKTVTFSCWGAQYKADELRIKRGESHGLRNKITANNAVFRLLGQGLLVCHAGK